MVVGHALEQHFTTIQLHSEIGTEFYCTDTKLLGDLIGDGSIVANELSPYLIQVWCIKIPDLCIRNFNIGNDMLFLMACHAMARQLGSVAIDSNTISIHDIDFDIGSFLLCKIGELCRDADKLIVPSGNVKGIAVKVHVARCTYQTDISEDSATSVPS